MYDNVPQELKNLKHWCCFKLQKRGEKLTKIPIDANTGNPGKSNDESTWSDFDTALNAINKFRCNGIGIYFKYPYFGIDIDDVPTDIKRYKNNDHENNIVSEFIEMMGSYAEISVSGNGIHIISKGILPEGGRRKGKVEMYSEGRFFTISDNIIGSYIDIADDSDYGKVKYLHNKYIGESELIKNIPNDNKPGSDLTEEEIVRIASNSKNGLRFSMFLNGGWEQFYKSPSEARMALCNDLAFWTNRDFNKMDSIFRKSSVYDQKWDEKRGGSTYGDIHLNKAINECANVFNPQRESDDFNIYILENDIKKIKRNFYSYDDTGNAERFFGIYGDAVRYNFNRKVWHFYDGKVWVVDQQGMVQKLVSDVIVKMKDEPIFVPEGEGEEEMQKVFQKHIKSSRSNKSRKNMIEVVQHLIPIQPHVFDKSLDVFNVQNGYLDLKTGALHEHDKDKYFTRISPVEYTDKSDCPMWEEFLETIFNGDKSLINYIQTAVGYSLCGSTEEQVMFILYGNGRNGKSVFLNIITELFGNYTANISPDALMTKKANGGANSEIARLDGVRLATTSESSDGDRLAEGLVKQLTGGDTITARFLYGNEFDFIPQFKLWMTTNHKPIIRGTDDGIWRRLAIIPFTKQIPLDKVEKNLTNKLKRELPAILNWALEGHLKWRSFGLQEPKIVRDQRSDYRKEMDVIECFIDDCCEVGKEKQVKSKVLYETYRDWARENGQYSMSSTKFGREVSKRFGKKREASGYYFQEIGLNTEYFRLSVAGL